MPGVIRYHERENKSTVREAGQHSQTHRDHSVNFVGTDTGVDQLPGGQVDRQDIRHGRSQHRSGTDQQGFHQIHGQDTSQEDNGTGIGWIQLLQLCL